MNLIKILALLPFFIMMTISCAGSRHDQSSSAEGAYITDFSEGDHLKTEVMKAIGTDSSGIDATNHIRKFEEGFEEIFSIYPDVMAATGYDNTSSANVQLMHLYERRRHDEIAGVELMNKLRVDGFIKALEGYLKRSHLESWTILNEKYDSFVADKKEADARMGLAAGYILLITDSKKVKTPEIVRKMRSLTDFLGN